MGGPRSGRNASQARITLMKRLLLAGVAGLLLVGCSSDPYYGGGGIDKSTGGALLGGVGGALLGSQIGGGSGRLVATAGGTLLGAFLGHSIGQSLDRADRSYAGQAYQQAQRAPVGQSISWNNPQNGNYGTVTPVRDGRGTSGEYCREFQQTIVVDGRPETAYGTACQSPNGSWRVVD